MKPTKFTLPLLRGVSRGPAVVPPARPFDLASDGRPA